MNSIFDIPAAFEPFYDTPVAFHGRRAGARPVDLTVDCCVFEGGFDDPLLEQNADTDVRVVGLSFPISGWLDTTPPQVGERVTFENKPFFVEKVERILSDYHVTIREGAA